jgi:3'-phosphoadenosine 5'-phosphosulfate sulfotransferase (PAPS reductase)/FAD synthetase
MNLADFLTRYAAPAAQTPTKAAVQAPTKVQAPKKAAAKTAAQQAVVKQTLPVGVGPRQGLPQELERVEKFFVAFSGGKDSVACVLHLLDLGIPKERIELWHYMMDPSDKPFMDWPITEDYCRKFAKAFDLPLLFAGRVGGFEQEMLRENAPAGDVFYTTITPKGALEKRVLKPAEAGKRVTKLAFPPPVGSLQARWCSSALKIEVGSRIINNDPRIQQGTFCVVTGIRAEESAQRASQEPLLVESALSRSVRPQDIRGTQRKREVWTWLAVHDWPEADVWKIMKKYGVNPHPAYHIGFGRVSCMTCIFADRDQWATIQELNPERFDRIADYEDFFGALDAARRVDRVRKQDADPDVVPQGERWKKGDPIPHGGAISILNVGTQSQPKYRKIRELVRGGYRSKRGDLAVYLETSDAVLRNLVNAVVQASTAAQRSTILEEARADKVGVETVATLPKALITQYKKQMLKANPPKKSVEDYFKAVEEMRTESIVIPPARSYVEPGMEREARLSQSDRYTDTILLSPSQWVQPAGAFKRDGGPG